MRSKLSFYVSSYFLLRRVKSRRFKDGLDVMEGFERRKVFIKLEITFKRIFLYFRQKFLIFHFTNFKLLIKSRDRTYKNFHTSKSNRQTHKTTQAKSICINFNALR